MNDITIIVPVHVFNENVKEMLDNALDSVLECQKQYENGKLNVLIVSSKEAEKELMDRKYVVNTKIIVNEGETDFCSQINFAVDHVETDFFSILEFDDEYTPKWFKCANEYYYGNESISMFLPVNILYEPEDDSNEGKWQYFNTMALSPAFITPDANDTDDIGIINRKRLEGCSVFNVTGAIINTKDFIRCGKYKPSIKLAFNYELMLRMTEKGCKLMVVPKEGYIHIMARKGSLTEEYLNTTTDEERMKWFSLAVRECVFDEDRKKDIANVKEEVLK